MYKQQAGAQHPRAGAVLAIGGSNANGSAGEMSGWADGTSGLRPQVG